MITYTEDSPELLPFIEEIISTVVAKELKIPEEEVELDSHETTYGVCKKPFGILRIRIVEFLTEAYQ
jgi:hypothetical protein